MARNEPTQQPSSSGSNGLPVQQNGSAKPSKVSVKGKFSTFFLFVNILCTVINAAFTKPVDCYVEISSDTSSAAPKKTTVKKKSSTPEWNEHLNVHANDSSTLSFRLLQKAKLFDDTCLGIAKVKLSGVAKNENGECKWQLFFFLSRSIGSSQKRTDYS